MANHRLGDGAVVQRLVDVVALHRVLRRVEDGQVDQHILLVEDFLLLDADVGAQAQVLDPNARHSRFQSHGRCSPILGGGEYRTTGAT
ncbi:hypothetical protein D3C77_613130 [compost metagenome]